MADVRVKSDQLVGISGGFSTHMNFLVEVVNALVVALETSKGMAGDDGGGRNFAKVYQGAVREAVAQMSFSTYAMGNLSATVMEMAFDLLATENRHQPGHRTVRPAASPGPARHARSDSARRTRQRPPKRHGKIASCGCSLDL